MKSFSYMNTTTYRRIPDNITRAEYRKKLRADRKARVIALGLLRERQTNGVRFNISWRGESKLESSRQKQCLQSKAINPPKVRNRTQEK